MIDGEIEAKMRSLKAEAEENAKRVNRLVDILVSKYNRDLEDLITVYKEKLASGRELTDKELENAVLKIPIFMYFTASGLETLGVEGDNAAAIRKAAFNQAYMKHTGTINDKTAAAEMETIPEALLEVAFTRAYKRLKTQVEMAAHIYSGFKKVLSKRMLEIEASMRELGYTRPPEEGDE